jgi:hypothetical protein
MTYEHLWHTYGTFYTHLGGGVNGFSVCGMDGHPTSIPAGGPGNNLGPGIYHRSDGQI